MGKITVYMHLKLYYFSLNFGKYIYMIKTFIYIKTPTRLTTPHSEFSFLIFVFQSSNIIPPT